MPEECDGLIAFQAQTIGSHVENFGRQHGGRKIVLHYRCPVCGKERRLVKNWHGPTPNGGIRCGARREDAGTRDHQS